MGPLDREKIKNLGGPANATHLRILLSPVTSRMRISAVTGQSSHQRLPVETGATRSACLAPFGCTERSLAGGAAVTHHRATDPHPVGTGWKAAVDMMLCVRRGELRPRPTSDPGDLIPRVEVP
jgi:hypothetical protein